MCASHTVEQNFVINCFEAKHQSLTGTASDFNSAVFSGEGFRRIIAVSTLVLLRPNMKIMHVCF